MQHGETGKTRSQRIQLDYHRRPDIFYHWRLRLVVVALGLVGAYLVVAIVSASVGSRSQLLAHCSRLPCTWESTLKSSAVGRAASATRNASSASARAGVVTKIRTTQNGVSFEPGIADARSVRQLGIVPTRGHNFQFQHASRQCQQGKPRGRGHLGLRVEETREAMEQKGQEGHERRDADEDVDAAQ